MVRKPNAAYRSREHLTEREVERLIEATKDNRWGNCDATMVILAFRHGAEPSRTHRESGNAYGLENSALLILGPAAQLRPDDDDNPGESRSRRQARH